MPKFYLPKASKKSEVAKALDYHYDRGTRELTQRSQYWTLSHWYLQGVRNFRLKGVRDGGLPASSFTDTKGRRRVRYERALVQCQVEMGRILGIDRSPAVQRESGVGLDKLRSESLSQAILEHIKRKQSWGALSLAHAYQLVCYGTSGVAVVQPEPFLGQWEPAIELVPPWELRPLPGYVTGTDQVGGISWSRWVPLEWLKTQYKKRAKLPRDIEQRHLVSASLYGEEPQAIASPGRAYNEFGGVVPSASMGTASAGTGGGAIEHEATTTYIELRESWLTAHDGSAYRYIVQAGGGEPIVDADFTEDEWQDRLGGILPMCPVSVARYSEVGAFYGRGFADRQIPLNREQELMLGDILESVREADRLRILAIPTTSGINVRQFRETVKRDRFMSYQPDYAAPQHQPQIISPPNMGNAFQQTFMMVDGMQQQLAAQGELLYGGVPGRVDSTGAVAMLAEYQNVPISVVSESIASCWSHTWKACLGYVKFFHDKVDPNLLIQVGALDQGAVGLVLDPNGGVELSDKAIPDPHDLTVTIRSKDPRSKNIIRGDLDAMLKAGLISQVGYRIMADKEGLDLPLEDHTAYEHWKTAWWENLVMFGDGETPGEIEGHSYGDNHTIHYLVCRAIIAMTIFRKASKAVQRKIESHCQWHAQQMGVPADPVETINQMTGGVEPGNPQIMQMLGMGGPPGMGAATPNPY